MMNMKTPFSISDFVSWAQTHHETYQDNYYAMYSSLWNAITTDPNLMMIPLDDHMVHRGDGLFESFKCEDGAIYNFDAHLQRLLQGTERLNIHLPWSDADIRDITLAVLKAGRQPNAMVRLFVSRGPGGHSVNPYESPRPALYIAAIHLGKAFMETHPEGAKVGISRIPAHGGWFSQIKSVNYLPNVLMKKEAVDTNMDFMLGFDTDGHMTELPTENMGIVTADNVLKIPKLENILAGTTMLRVLDLAKQHLLPAGTLTGIQEADLSVDDVRRAKEMLIFGTTPNVTAVTTFDGHPVGRGAPGPIYEALSGLFNADLKNPAMQTVVDFNE